MWRLMTQQKYNNNKNAVFSLQTLKGRRQKYIFVTKEKPCPPVRLNTTAGGAGK